MVVLVNVIMMMMMGSGVRFPCIFFLVSIDPCENQWILCRDVVAVNNPQEISIARKYRKWSFFSVFSIQYLYTHVYNDNKQHQRCKIYNAHFSYFFWCVYIVCCMLVCKVSTWAWVSGCKHQWWFFSSSHHHQHHDCYYRLVVASLSSRSTQLTM